MEGMDKVLNIIVIIGIPSAIGAFVYIGRKLQILSDLKTDVAKIKNNLKVVSDYLTKHQNKFNPSGLPALSPLQLTEEGKKFIENLGKLPSDVCSRASAARALAFYSIRAYTSS